MSSVQLGMPHLDLNGLSENWLLRECGHRHWNAICDLVHVQSHELCDNLGNRIYASFVAVEIYGDSLHNFEENDTLAFNMTLKKISRYQFFSSQAIISDCKKKLINVHMTTIFVKKPVFENNHIFVKDCSSILSKIPVEDPGVGSISLINEHKIMKKHVHNLEKLLPEKYFVYHICPFTDFNGARFLYFANYPSIMDRAEWAILGYKDMEFFSTQHRKIFYFGNVNMHDVLRVFILNVRKEAFSYEYDGLILRESDEKPLMFMRTRKIGYGA